MANTITQEASLVGHMKPNVNLSGNMSVPKVYYEGTSSPATKDTLGLIKVGENLNITEDGTLSADVPTKVSQLENDADYITSSDIPVMDANTVGGAKLGDGLKIDEAGVLSVDVATKAEEDNTKPITSAAVNTLVGNIDALLSTI